MSTNPTHRCSGMQIVIVICDTPSIRDIHSTDKRHTLYRQETYTPSIRDIHSIDKRHTLPFTCIMYTGTARARLSNIVKVPFWLPGTIGQHQHRINQGMAPRMFDRSGRGDDTEIKTDRIRFDIFILRTISIIPVITDTKPKTLVEQIVLAKGGLNGDKQTKI